MLRNITKTLFICLIVPTMACGGGGASSPTPDGPPADDAQPDSTPATEPGAATDVVATRGDGEVTVTWSAPASDGGSDITGYVVSEVTPNAGGATATTTGATSAVVTGLSNGTAYTFEVIATNAVGDGPASAASNEVSPAGVPDAPTAVAAVAAHTQATVSWTTPASDNGEAIIDYAVVASPGGATATSVASPAVITGLTNGTAYTFTVTARNDVGSSAASAASAAVTPARPVCSTAFSFTTKTPIATGTLPIGVAAGDWNGDSIPDLAIIAYSSAQVRIVLGVGDGTFGTATDLTTGTNPYGIAAGDMDADGDQDLVVANYTSGTLSLFRGAGDGTFAAKVDTSAGFSPRDIALGDIDGDGDLDVVYGGTLVGVIKNDGTGALSGGVTHTVGTNPNGVTLGDFNGDGDLDIGVAVGVGPHVGTLANNGSGTFSAAVLLSSLGVPANVVAGDLDGDGDLDLAMSLQTNNQLSMHYNNGAGVFSGTNYQTAGSNSNPIGLEIGDIDNDGDLDLVSANYGNNLITIYRNSGNGLSYTTTTRSAGAQLRWVALKDLNGDGYLDLITVNGQSNTVSIDLVGC